MLAVIPASRWHPIFDVLTVGLRQKHVEAGNIFLALRKRVLGQITGRPQEIPTLS